VLLDHDGAQRHGRKCRVVPERVIREADRLAVALAELGEHVEADPVGGRRIRGRALEHRHVVACCGNGSIELGPRRHPRRQQHGPARRPDAAHQLEVGHLAGADLVAPHAQLLQALDRFDREHRAEKLDLRAVARLLQRPPLLVREGRSSEVLPTRFVLEVRRRRRVARGLRVRVVQLELHCIGAALRGHLGEADRVAEAAVVVHSCLGDHEDAPHARRC
jgi:hypothetical protein